jgi:cell division inhibitor SulA/protein ImuA
MNALPLPVALADVLARGDVWRGDTLASLPEAAIPSGHPEFDAELPGGGWPRGNLTEFLVERSGIGELSLLLPALASLSAGGGWLALVAPPWLPHAPAWAAAGVALERLVVVRAGKDAAWSIEQLLVCGGFAGVLAWPGEGIDAKALRRLQVAAEGRSALACLWRSMAAADTPSPAPLRVALVGGDEALTVRILKRRGRPASRPLDLPFSSSIPRPARHSRVVAGPAFSLVVDRGIAATPVA